MEGKKKTGHIVGRIVHCWTLQDWKWIMNNVVTVFYGNSIKEMITFKNKK